MCGIVGIVSLDPDAPIDASRVTRMRDTVTHRGPDAAGIFVEGPVGLGHRRLSIIDVSGGHQPMANPDRSAWLVYNGEIYNHVELRRELEAKGHRYRTRCDTEGILHLYDEYGEGFVDHLHGMFALAIWDVGRRQLLLTRDRLGIKPLYYALTDRELVFASEIKAILAAGGVRAALNEQVVPEFLATRFVSGEETMFRGIRKVLPGHTLTWSRADGLRARRYWQLPAANSVRVDGFAQEAASLRLRLEGAVRRHLMSDVPLGVFLSGGIDSSALAAMASKMVDEPLRTFSVGFAEKEANELPYARLAARHIGAQHREVLVTPDDFFEALPRLIWHEDEPIAFTSSVPLYFVSKLAAEHVKVVLTGEGADELFLGYTRYLVTLWNSRLGRLYGTVTTPGMRGAVRRALEGLPRRITRYTQRTFLAIEPNLRDLFFENFAVFSTWRQQGLLADGPATGRDPYAVALGCFDRTGGGILDRMSHADLQTYLHELLMKQDQMSMAASIESRVPFLDDDLIGHVPALPAWVKLRGRTTKAVLRAAIGDLVPPEILHRGKMGFPVPIGRWLRGEHWNMVERFVLSPRALDRGLFVRQAVARLAAEHRSGQVDHGDRLWLLMNLEIWQRVFCDGEDPAGLTRAM